MNTKTVSPRHQKRLKAREKTKIDAEFQELVESFVQSLFGYDFDEHVDLEAFPVFEKYNGIWVKYCKEWLKQRRATAPNPFAFYDFAINQDDKGVFDIQVEREVAQQRIKEFEEQLKD